MYTFHFPGNPRGLTSLIYIFHCPTHLMYTFSFLLICERLTRLIYTFMFPVIRETEGSHCNMLPSAPYSHCNILPSARIHLHVSSNPGKTDTFNVHFPFPGNPRKTVL